MQHKPLPSKGLLARLGPLRAGLAVFVLACLPLAFFAGREPEGWYILPVFVAPVMVVIFIWLLLFDMLMSRVLAGEKPPAEQARLHFALRVDVVLLVALLLFWGPFFYSLVRG